MSKLSFRARALDASKPMPIFMAEELPDLPDYSAINRAVPQMPSGMQKEEECEHHLQRAIVAGLIIPTPEVSDIPNREFYDKVYPANYKQPRQLIHMQPFTMEQDIPDYDMDSDDERWLQSQTQKLDLSPLKFEEMMDRLEKSSGQTVVTLGEAKALLKEDDDLIIAVFDYWLNKRLKTQHPLILTVRTEHRAGQAANNPYLAFRRRTEKMQTRKNRKNDEASYEKMLKLRRDLYRAVTLLELVKRREKIKREYVHLSIEVFEKRYQAKDFSGSVLAEASAIKSSRPAFTPIFHNHYPNQSWSNKAILKDEVIPRREKRQYKKRKHKASSVGGRSSGAGTGLDTIGGGGLSSDEESVATSSVLQVSPDPEEADDEGQFAFRRNKLCSYHMPLPHEGNWPWCSQEEHGLADKRFRFTLTSLSNPKRCIGFARRRLGRGGRIILDRVSTPQDDFWRSLDFTIHEPNKVDQQEEKRSGDISESVSCSSNSSTVLVGRTTSGVSDSLTTIKTEFKKEVMDGVEPLGSVPPTAEEKDDMVEFLRSLRRDWLHFRPKTPPPDYEPPCDMLLSQDTFFSPGTDAPFSIEILPDVDSVNSSMPYLTRPFTFDDSDSTDTTPVTDTRQTLSPTPYALPPYPTEGLEDIERSVGCSSFIVTDESLQQRLSNEGRFELLEDNNTKTFTSQNSQTSSTSTSPKRSCGNGRGGSVATLSRDGVVRGRKGSVTSDVVPLPSTNGLLPQFTFDVPSNRTRNNKLSYAYSGAVGYPNASSSTLSLHTSAHTLTLNSHSANILDIPMANETVDAASSPKVGAADSATANNKSKAMIEKS